MGRVKKYLRHGRYAKLIGQTSPVYLAAVLEYLVAEVFDLAADSAHQNKRQRIKPRDITLIVRNDAELGQLLKNVEFSQGGIVPFIHDVLLPKTKSQQSSQKSSSVEM